MEHHTVAGITSSPRISHGQQGQAALIWNAMSVWNLANQSLKSLVPYEPGKPVDDVARELGLEPSQVIKLASNENPLGPSPKAVEAMQSVVAKTQLYPDGGGFHLRNAIADKFGIERTQVVLGNGSNEIIELAYHGFTSLGTANVVASRYAFAVYRLMAELFGVEFVEAADNHYHHDLEALANAVNEKTRLLFIANPNNPTGTRIPNNDLKSFLDSLPDHLVCVLDEAYYEFLDDAPPSIEWVKEGRNLIVMRTFSKIQGLAGLRIGYGVTTPEIAEILQRCRQPFNANVLAQTAALAGLLDQEHQDKTKEMTLKGRDELFALCKELGLETIPSDGNFVTLRVGDSTASAESKPADIIFKALLQKGIIVRSLSSYGMPEWIRVSIGTPKEMERFHRTFPQVLEHAQATSA